MGPRFQKWDPDIGWIAAGNLAAGWVFCRVGGLFIGSVAAALRDPTHPKAEYSLGRTLINAQTGSRLSLTWGYVVTGT